MDSLRGTGLTTSIGFIYWTDLLSGILMCIMFSVQIYYLYLKTKRIANERLVYVAYRPNGRYEHHTHYSLLPLISESKG